MIPKLSVIVCAYNEEKYILQAIESVLKQSFSNFELIFIDDCSTDNTLLIVKSIQDSRLRIIENADQKGPAECSNIGMRLAKGEYIARQDGDDYSALSRFEKQIQFLESNKDVAIVGTWFELVDADGIHLEWCKMVLNPYHIAFNLLFDSALVHSSVMFKKKMVLDAVGFYNSDRRYTHDYDYWCKISRVFNISNISEFLTSYRLHPGSLTANSRTAQTIEADIIREGQLLHYLENDRMSLLNSEDRKLNLWNMWDQRLTSSSVYTYKEFLQSLFDLIALTRSFISRTSKEEARSNELWLFVIDKVYQNVKSVVSNSKNRRYVILYCFSSLALYFLSLCKRILSLHKLLENKFQRK